MLNQDVGDDAGCLRRAEGCLLGQLAGDALGSLVEFESEASIRRTHPNGVRELAASPVWGTLPGQPTDDSELALALARSLVGQATYRPEAALAAYRAWLDSGPFDVGGTTSAGLRGHPRLDSQANGALMRVSPLGIFGARRGDEATLAAWARQDALLTHPHPVCQGVNVLFVLAIAKALREATPPAALHAAMLGWAEAYDVSTAVREALEGAADTPPGDYQSSQGWVLIAFRNAVWQSLHAATAEEAIVDTVGRGGDTDTNAAICGALVGAIHGREAIPARWRRVVLACRPEAGRRGVMRPRPADYWPIDALELAAALLGTGA